MLESNLYKVSEEEKKNPIRYQVLNMLQSNSGQAFPLQKGTAIIVRSFSFLTYYEMKQVTHWDLGNPIFSWLLLVQLGLGNDLKAVTNLTFISVCPRC